MTWQTVVFITVCICALVAIYAIKTWYAIAIIKAHTQESLFKIAKGVDYAGIPVHMYSLLRHN